MITDSLVEQLFDTAIHVLIAVDSSETQAKKLHELIELFDSENASNSEKVKMIITFVDKTLKHY